MLACALFFSSAPRRAPAAAPSTVLWHAGNFRYLDALQPGTVQDDTYTLRLQDDAANLNHPYRPQGGYGKVSSTRRDKFNLFLAALFGAIRDSVADGSTGDWCGVKSKAADAGYDIWRYYESEFGRWLVYGRDRTQFGQAHFFINPFAKRNLVIEVPHGGYDTGTEREGAQLFTALAARVLIINKEDRCSDPDSTTCQAETNPSSCDGRIHESDVAHQPANTFHLLHVWLNDNDPNAKFVQLHGMTGTPSDVIEVGDSSKSHSAPNSVSVRFANNLRSVFPSGGANVYSCQEGTTPLDRCGTTNLQGRYTNDPTVDACSSTGTYQSSSRMLHLEQATKLRNNDPTDGWHWTQIRDALALTWPCDMNNGAADCTMGPPQTQYSTWACPASGAATVQNVKVTFYGYPDNEDDVNSSHTNVIAYARTWLGQPRHTDAQGRPVAGGVGTYADPVTVAAAENNPAYPPGKLVYFPGLRKYFLVEDICGNCTSDWLDLWMESNANSNDTAVLNCEDSWTGDPTVLKEVWRDPASDLAVDTAPFFNTGTNTCRSPTW